MNDGRIGIIGGMGPEATADLYMKIIKNTVVTKDQDHYRVIIDSNSKIPDRTDSIINHGESPVPALIETAKNLEKLNVQVACIPCVTAHYFYDQIQASVNYKIINLIENAADYIDKGPKDVRKIGILSTTGTIATRLFDKYLDDYELVYPSKEIQENYVMKAIYGKEGIKAGRSVKKAQDLLVRAGNSLINQGAQVLIAGCTEIGLVLSQDMFSVPIYDLLEIASKALINYNFDE